MKKEKAAKTAVAEPIPPAPAPVEETPKSSAKVPKSKKTKATPVPEPEPDSTPSGKKGAKDKRTTMDARARLFSLITDALKAGTVPWHRTYKTIRPRSFVRGTIYKGMNLWTTTLANFSSPFWFTFNDLKTLAGDLSTFVDADGNPIPLVKKGEHGVPIVFWKRLPIYKNKAEVAKGAEPIIDKVIPLFRYSVAFNLAQVNLPPAVLTKVAEAEAALVPVDESAALAAIEDAMKTYISKGGPKVVHQRDSAFYAPKTDVVNTPAKTHYESLPAYYADLLHELSHSTGHDSRLHRFEAATMPPFGAEPYAEEELVAEMAAAFLCDEFGIAHKTLENSAAYIDGWLKVFEGDHNLLIKAGGLASKAADFFLGKQYTPQAEAQGSES